MSTAVRHPTPRLRPFTRATRQGQPPPSSAPAGRQAGELKGVVPVQLTGWHWQVREHGWFLVHTEGRETRVVVACPRDIDSMRQ